MFGWKVIGRIGIGPIGVSPHGVGIAFGCFVGAWLMARRCRALGIDENHAWNTAAWGVVGAIFGARIAYVVGHVSSFSGPVEWLEIWHGGISLIGGLLGGTLLAALYFRRHQLDFWEFADLAAPSLALGVALGRSGDLVIGDHLGKPTHFFLGWVYKGGTLISPPPCLTPSGAHVYPTASGCILPGIEVHQTALYDSLWCFVIFGVLYWLSRRPVKRGLLFLVWAGMYTTGRIVTDFLRVDKRWILGLTGSQITSILVVALCAYLIARYRGAPGVPAAVTSPEMVRVGRVPIREEEDVSLAALTTVRVIPAERSKARVEVTPEEPPDEMAALASAQGLGDEPEPLLEAEPPAEAEPVAGAAAEPEPTTVEPSPEPEAEADPVPEAAEDEVEPVPEAAEAEAEPVPDPPEPHREPEELPAPPVPTLAVDPGLLPPSTS